MNKEVKVKVPAYGLTKDTVLRLNETETAYYTVSTDRVVNANGLVTETKESIYLNKDLVESNIGSIFEVISQVDSNTTTDNTSAEIEALKSEITLLDAKLAMSINYSDHLESVVKELKDKLRLYHKYYGPFWAN